MVIKMLCLDLNLLTVFIWCMNVRSQMSLSAAEIAFDNNVSEVFKLTVWSVVITCYREAFVVVYNTFYGY